jgi:hypothetical protein
MVLDFGSSCMFLKLHTRVMAELQVFEVKVRRLKSSKCGTFW